MGGTLKLSYTAALVLQTISAGYNYGFDIMEVTGLPSGTVYPTLRRLEQQELVKSSWETKHTALAPSSLSAVWYVSKWPCGPSNRTLKFCVKPALLC